MNELLKLTDNDLKLPTNILQEAITEERDSKVGDTSLCPLPPNTIIKQITTSEKRLGGGAQESH